MLFIAPGGYQVLGVADSDNPLPEAIRSAFGGDTWVADFVNYSQAWQGALIASFFSIVFTAPLINIAVFSATVSYDTFMMVSYRAQDQVSPSSEQPTALPAGGHDRRAPSFLALTAVIAGVLRR